MGPGADARTHPPSYRRSMALQRSHGRTAPAEPAVAEPAPAGFFGALLGDLCRGLFHDLVRDAFAFRPLRQPRPLPAAARVPVPAAVRGALRRAPHAGVLLLALSVAGLQAKADIAPGDEQFGVCLLAVALLTTLCLPVVSGWLLLLALGVSLFPLDGVAPPFPFADLSHSDVLQYNSEARPWAWAGFLAFVALLVILGLRLRLRAVAGLWVLAVALAAVGNGRFIVGTAVVALLSAVMPLVGAVFTSWREAREDAAAHAAATGEERSRRMLLEERAVIARELHDVVAHHMSVIAIQAEAAPYRVTDPPPELEKAFGTVRESAVAALAELRRVLGVIRTESSLRVTADGGGVEAPLPVLGDLDSLLAGVEAAGTPAGKTVTGDVRALPRGVELSAYRIVQEALSNSLRHAPNACVRVELAYAADGLGLRVVNGPSTHPASPSPGAGHGLTGMRERAAMLGGRLTAGPTGDGGFEVAGFLPSGRAEALDE